MSPIHQKIFTAVAIGGRILGRSFMEAYRQAAASSQYQRSQVKSGGSNSSSATASLASSMTLDEACKVLNIKPPAEGTGAATLTEATNRYKSLFDANDPQKGGSFYLQSKVVRARERVEREVRPMITQEEVDAEVKQGWRPKVYKDK